MNQTTYRYFKPDESVYLHEQAQEAVKLTPKPSLPPKPKLIRESPIYKVPHRPNESPRLGNDRPEPEKKSGIARLKTKLGLKKAEPLAPKATTQEKVEPQALTQATNQEEEQTTDPQTTTPVTTPQEKVEPQTVTETTTSKKEKIVESSKKPKETKDSSSSDSKTKDSSSKESTPKKKTKLSKKIHLEPDFTGLTPPTSSEPNKASASPSPTTLPLSPVTQTLAPPPSSVPAPIAALAAPAVPLAQPTMPAAAPAAVVAPQPAAYLPQQPTQLQAPAAVAAPAESAVRPVSPVQLPVIPGRSVVNTQAKFMGPIGSNSPQLVQQPASQPPAQPFLPVSNLPGPLSSIAPPSVAVSNPSPVTVPTLSANPTLVVPAEPGQDSKKKSKSSRKRAAKVKKQKTKKGFSFSKLMYRSFISLSLIAGGIGIWLIVEATVLQKTAAEQQWQTMLANLMQTETHSYELSLNSPALKDVFEEPESGHQFSIKNEVYAQWAPKSLTPTTTHKLDLELSKDQAWQLDSSLTYYRPAGQSQYLQYNQLQFNEQPVGSEILEKWLEFDHASNLLAEDQDFSSVTSSLANYYLYPDQTILLPMFNVKDPALRTRLIEILTAKQVYSAPECARTAGQPTIICSVSVNHGALYDFYNQAHQELDLQMPAHYSILQTAATETNNLLPIKIDVSFNSETNAILKMSGSVPLNGTTQKTQFGVVFGKDFSQLAISNPADPIQLGAYIELMAEVDQEVDLSGGAMGT